MPPNRRKYSLLRILPVFVAGVALLTTTVRICLLDSAISGTFWPDDINVRVIRSLGGDVARDFVHGTRLQLSWLGVCLRVGGSLLLASGVSAFLQCRVLRRGPSGRPAEIANWQYGTDVYTMRLHRVGVRSSWSVLWLAVCAGSSLFPGSVLEQFFYLTPTFWMACLGAWIFCGLWPDWSPSESGGGSVWPLVVTGLLTVLWIAVSFWMNERLYAGLRIPHGDSAMYEEHLWNVWHGKGFRSYLDQGLFLGEHIQVIHLLLLPLHMLWPSHLLLELAESVALGICVIPICRMAFRHSGSRTAAAWLSVAWLFFYPMHFLDIAIDLKTLRPSCYGLPFLLWGIDLAERHRWKAAGLCLLVAMSAQEDFALIIGPVGLVLWWHHRQESRRDPAAAASARRALLTACLSFVYLVAAVTVIIPAFRGGMAVHYSRYFGDLGSSPGDLARTLLQDPLRVAGRILSLRTLFYVLTFSVPLGFLIFRSPFRLMAGMLTLTMLSLIQLGNESGGDAQPTSGARSAPGASLPTTAELPPVPYHHFHAPLLPVLFWAAAAGLRDGSSVPRQVLQLVQRWGVRGSFSAAEAARFACCCSIITAAWGSLMPCGAAFWSEQAATGYRQRFVPGLRSQHFPRVLAQLPITSRVASTDYVHTRLTHHERSYDYSDYLRAVNRYRPGVPDDTDYIVIDTRHPYSKIHSPEDVRELQESPEHWTLLPDQTDGYFIILKRRLPE